MSEPKTNLTATSIVKPVLNTEGSETAERNVAINVKNFDHPSKVSVSASKKDQNSEKLKYANMNHQRNRIF